MTSVKKGVPNLGAVLSKLSLRSEGKSDSAPPSPVVGLRKAVSGDSLPYSFAARSTCALPAACTAACYLTLYRTVLSCFWHLEAPGDVEPDVLLDMHAGTDMTSTPNPLMTPFDRKKANAIGLRKWVRFASDGETTIMQV